MENEGPKPGEVEITFSTIFRGPAEPASELATIHAGVEEMFPCAGPQVPPGRGPVHDHLHYVATFSPDPKITSATSQALLRSARAALLTHASP